MAAETPEATELRQLLVAMDQEPASTLALARAIRIAGETGAAIRIVQAIAPWLTIEEALALRRRILVEARLMAEEMLGATLPISATLSRRRPAAVILRAADTAGADLILLGGHRPPRFRDALLGTVAGQVVRRSSRPVLIVQTRDALPYRKLMVALDDPGRAGPVLAAALAIAPAAEEIFAVHACDPPASPLFGEGPSRAELRDLETGIHAFLRARTAQRRVKTEEAVVESGEVSAVLSEQVFAHAPDLVAIGRHRRSLFLASHAGDALGWCRSDLLVVPDAEAAGLPGLLSATG